MVEEKYEALSLMIDALDLMELCDHSDATIHLQTAIDCLGRELDDKANPATANSQTFALRIEPR